MDFRNKDLICNWFNKQNKYQVDFPFRNRQGRFALGATVFAGFDWASNEVRPLSFG